MTIAPKHREPPRISHEVRYRVAEHEVLLSFVNDSDADAFHEWWAVFGLRAFLRWGQDNTVEVP